MTYKIVVGVDGSLHGDAALRWALAEAKAHDGQVTAVFAWQMPFISNPAAFDRAELEQAAKSFIVNQVSSVSPSPPVPLTPLVAEGDPAEALVKASEDADLLVVGTRGQPALRRRRALPGHADQAAGRRPGTAPRLILDQGGLPQSPPRGLPCQLG